MITVLIPIEIDEHARQLCADVREAMRRADCSLKYVALTICVPESKLSDQLNAKVPFTYLWRFTRLGDAFWNRLDDVRAERRGATFIASPDLVALLASVRTIGKFVKAQLPAFEDERQVM